MGETNQGNKKVTLQDIALKTGYTKNTVSRALRNKPEISKATRKLKTWAILPIRLPAPCVRG
jgi:transcriptional regulator with XRE-family HTH domain